MCVEIGPASGPAVRASFLSAVLLELGLYCVVVVTLHHAGAM